MKLFFFIYGYVIKIDANASTSSSSDDANVSSNSVIMKMKNVKLAVWKYFGYKNNVAMNDEVAVCLLCKKICYIARGGNTSNLISHLKTHHPLKHEEF